MAGIARDLSSPVWSGPDQYEREFGPRFGVPFSPERPAQAITTAGPFTLAYRSSRGPDGSIQPKLQVLAPDIPNLSYSLISLEIALREPDLGRSWLHPRYRFGRPELVSDVDMKGASLVRSYLEGELVLRLASDVRALTLPAVEPGRSVEAEGVRLLVTELGRDRFSALVEGDPSRLVAVQALDADGATLVVQPIDAQSRESGVLRSFRVSGQLSSLQVQVARDAERRVYPFRLDLPSAAPASPSDP